MAATATEDLWAILNAYFQDHPYAFVKHHLDSYREFLRKDIPVTIRSFNPMTMVKYKDNAQKDILLKVDIYVGGKGDELKLYVDRPVLYDASADAYLLTPNEARLRNLTYQTHLYADVLIEYTDAKGTVTPVSFDKVLIATLPIMTHSDVCVLHKQAGPVLKELGECIYDQGGYFIIDGKEKAVVSQERNVNNRLYIRNLKHDDFSISASIKCAAESGDSALMPKGVSFFVIKHTLPRATLEPFADDTPSTGIQNDPDIREEYRPYRGAILVSVPNIRGTMPLCQLFRALGVESDEEILEHIFGPLEDVPQAMLDAIRPSIYHGQMKGDFTQKEVLQRLAPLTFFKGEMNVMHVLVNDVFPNMNPVSQEPDIHLFRSKAKYLGQLVREILMVRLNLRQPSDKDSYQYKRIDISGSLLAQLFQKAYMIFRKNVRDAADRSYYYVTKNRGDQTKLITKDDLHRVFNSMLITERIHKSFKGMWGGPSTSGDPEEAVVQDLARISYTGFLSHLRRVNIPFDRSIKLTGPHRLHANQFGRLCPFDTPDGASVGLLKALALLSHVTFGTSAEVMHACFQELGVAEIIGIPAPTVASPKLTRVFLNGRLYGIHENPLKLVRALRLYRRNGLFNLFTSIAWDIRNSEVRVLTDSGRPCRPLMIVENAALVAHTLDYLPSSAPAKLSWYPLIYGKQFEKNHKDFLKDNDRQDLYYNSFFISPLQNGANLDNVLEDLEKTQAAIEFIDADEEDTLLVATEPKDVGEYHTHCEIHASTIFSVVTTNIPFANHNQAPRNIFHCSQSKQAVGVYATNFNKRFDTMAYIQHYPQRPLVTTRGAQYNRSDRMPNGFNAIVAIATYTGYNQEDGVIINKTSVDRGLFHITAYKTMYAREEGDASEGDTEFRFANPVKLEKAGKKFASKIPYDKYDYSLLNDDGIIEENAMVPSGHAAAVIGMVKCSRKQVQVRKGILVETKIEEEFEDVTLKSDVHHYGKVDRVYMDKWDMTAGKRLCKVRFRKVRRPELGDKCCSRHGQKGVMGMIVPAEDMPFSKDGIVPDIIINPHAFPSRMTIGHLVECIFAKLCCMEGMLGDGTVFLPFDMDRVATALEGHGFERFGNEILYNGKTGEQIATEILIAPTFYMRLKHMVADKMHSRSTGPHDQLTRQPTSGRSNAGGLRIGEMERDVLLSYGFSQFAKESMMERSDKHCYHVCRQCGTMAVANRRKNYTYCTDCGGNNVAMVETPYAFKLLVQELEPMGIQVRMSTMPADHDDPMQDVENNYDDGDSNADATDLNRLDSIPEEMEDFDMVGGMPFDGTERNGGLPFTDPNHPSEHGDDTDTEEREDEEDDKEEGDEGEEGEKEHEKDEGEEGEEEEEGEEGEEGKEGEEGEHGVEGEEGDDFESDDGEYEGEYEERVDPGASVASSIDEPPLHEPVSHASLPSMSPQMPPADDEQSGGNIKIIHI